MTTLTMDQWRQRVLGMMMRNGVSEARAQQAINQYLQGVSITDQAAFNDLSAILGADNFLPPVSNATSLRLVGPNGAVAPNVGAATMPTGAQTDAARSGLPGATVASSPIGSTSPPPLPAGVVLSSRPPGSVGEGGLGASGGSGLGSGFTGGGAGGANSAPAPTGGGGTGTGGPVTGPHGTLLSTVTNPDGTQTETWSDGTQITQGSFGTGTGTGTPAPTAAPTAAPTPTVVGTQTNPDGSITEIWSDGTTTVLPNPNPPPANGVSGSGDQQVLNETIDGVTYSLSFNTAQDIINSALQTVGLDPTALAATGINAGQTLGNFFWSQIVNQGITDPTTIGDMIGTLLPSTGQFQTAFPGYHQALANGYVRTVAEYVGAEEGMTAVMLQGGVPKDMINPTTVGDLISKGVSVNEVAARVQNGLDAALNAPVEVQNYFAQEFGASQGPSALATVFLNPNIDAVTLQKMLAGAQIRGAASAQNLTMSQGLSQRLADQGQTYASAQQKFQTLAQQQGLFQQTVGERSSQQPVPGTINADKPLTESNQGVEAAFGISGLAMQQVRQAALTREADFKGGGGASTTQAEGYTGLGSARPE